MNPLHLYIAAGICVVTGLFLGFTEYLKNDTPDYDNAGLWVGGAVALLVVAYITSGLPHP